MIIGLTGAHRTGKTTLAREFVKRNKSFALAETSVSAIMSSKGLDPALDYPIGVRLEIQHTILDELDSFYARFTEMAIFDRTPLDAAAYLLADVQRQNVDPALHPGICAYVKRAIEVSNRRFTLMLFVPPVLPLVDEPGKAPATPAYVEHISQLINGLRSDERMKVKHFSLPRGYLDLDLRVQALENATARTLRNHLVEVETMTLNGTAVH